MKLFERPIAELIVFNVADVITTSPATCAADCGEDNVCPTDMGDF